MNTHGTLTRRLRALVAVGGLALGPSVLSAQKALVYCPVAIDPTGCTTLVQALGDSGGPFPQRVDMGYDGTAGTIDLASADLSSYAVFIVPALADNADTKPYDRLRTSTVANRLRTVLLGRIAVWSGTPDQGSVSRTEKNTLVRNLAVWGAANYATSGLRGLVALQDYSDSVAQRYGWVAAISRLAVAADSAPGIYSEVQALTATATELLNNGGQQLAYTNMASFGIEPPGDSSGATADARGGASGGQVVLVSSLRHGNGAATVQTDKIDYAPGQVVTITGSGWQFGEVVSLVLQEDPAIDTHPALTATADASGHIFNNEFAPDAHDVGVRFYLTATGQISGAVAQATFTDDNFAVSAISPTSGSTLGGSSVTIIGTGFSSGQAPYTVTFGSGTPVAANLANDQTLTANTPAHSAGTVDVIVNRKNGNSTTLTNGFTFTRANPTVTFTGAPASAAYQSIFTVASTTNSSTSPAYTSGGACSNLGATYTITSGTGTCTSSVTWAADANYNSATLSQSTSATKITPTVAFSGAPASAAYQSTFIVVSSTNTSASPVYSSSGVCSNAGATYAMTSGMGTCTSTVTWASDANYNGASLSQATTGTKIAPTVTFTGAPANAAYQSGFTVASSTNSSASPSYTASGVCTSVGTSFTMTSGTGTCTSTVTWAADGNYNGASLSQSTNALKAPQTISFGSLASKTYGDADFDVSATASSGLAVSFSASGNCTVSFSTVHITGAGSCTITASQGGNTNYNPPPDVAPTFAVTKAASTTAVSFEAGPYTYRGTAFTATAQVTGVGGLRATVTPVVYTGDCTNVTSANGCTATATYAGDPNHDGSSDGKSITITQATASTTVSCPAGPYTYDGTGQTPCSVTVTGAGGLSLTPTPSYSGNTNAGTATASYTFTGDANHTGSSDSKTFTIGRASSITVVSFEAGPYTYRGSAFTATVAVTGAGGLSLTPAPSYSGDCANVTGANGCRASYTWTPDANHTASSDNKSITITQAASTTTVTCPAGPYTYTGSAQTPCSVTVTGVGALSLTPTPSYSGNTNAGTATASYTFTGDANHTGSSDSKTFTIGQASSSTAVSCPATPQTYTGSPIAPCTATASGAGGLGVAVTPVNYTSNTNVGTAGASATYVGDANHFGSTGTGSFTIGQASSTVTVTCTAGAPYTYTGSPQTPCTAAATGVGMSPVDVSRSLSFANNVAAGSATAAASWAGDPNHTGSSGTGSFTIGQASSTVTVTCTAGAPYTYTGSPQTPCTAAASGAGGLNVAVTPVTYTSNTNVGTAGASATYGGDANHFGSTGTGSFAIGKAASATVVTFEAGPYTYRGTAFTATAQVSGVGGLNQAQAVVYSGDCTNVTSGGCTATATYAGDPNHNGSYAVGHLTVNPKALTVTANNKTKQYSDPLPAFDVWYSGLVPGPTVLGGTLSCATTATAMSAPGTYAITCSGQTSANYTITYFAGTLTVTQEDARAYYTGALFASTSGSTSSTATVTLAATIKDITAADPSSSPPNPDNFPGDIRYAKVTFIDAGTGATLCTNLPVGLVSPTDLTIGTATCNWSVNIGTQNSMTYTIGIIVNGYYTRNTSYDNTDVTVSLPLDNFITGGGALIMSSSSSGGLYAGAPGSNNNFGFNVKYNKQGTNLQGNINVIVRNGGRVYQIKGNSMTSLSTKLPALGPVTATNPATATFNGKASIQDITDPANVISMDGNATLQVTMHDYGEPGSSDSIGITVWNKAGGLWFASNWNGTQTVEQVLNGGNLVVH